MKYKYIASINLDKKLLCLKYEHTITNICLFYEHYEMMK